jgi:hypothetical protein
MLKSRNVYKFLEWTFQNLLVPILVMVSTWIFSWSTKNQPSTLDYLIQGVCAIGGWLIIRHFFFKPYFDKLKTEINDWRKEVNQIVGDRNITLNAQNIIKEKVTNPILKKFYENELEMIIKNAEFFSNKNKNKMTLKINNSLELYKHIISASKNFNKNICSVDCNIDLWKNICEVADYKKINVQKTEEEINWARAIDPTYKIFDAINNNLNKRKAGTDNAVRRIFYINKDEKDLNSKEKLVIYRFRNLGSKTAIRNKALFKTDIETLIKVDKNEKKIADFLKELQDVVIFDDNIAYKEYYIDNNEKAKDKKNSEMILDTVKIQKFLAIFNELFNVAKDLDRITLKDT